jgi:hypothetical protein
LLTRGRNSKPIMGRTSSEFFALIEKYEIERVFGVVLNHRHFNMSPNERLVEYAGTSVPWEKMPDRTQPNRWFVSGDNRYLPYKFHYSPDDDSDGDSTPDNQKYSEFINCFNDILGEKDALGLFGICRYAGDNSPNRVEITAGRANTNFHPDDIRSL